jgi:hypothetical protein
VPAVVLPAGSSASRRSAPPQRQGSASPEPARNLAADGVPVKDIVERVGVSKPTVIGWKKRYAAEGIDGLADRPKPGRRPVVDEAAVVTVTLEPPPARGDPLVLAAAGRRAGDFTRVDRQDLAPMGAAAVAD